MLLDSYANAAADRRSKQNMLRFHRIWIGDPMETLRTEMAPALLKSNCDWATTGAGASLLMVPYLTEVTRIDLYVDAELMSNPTRLSSLLGARIVEHGQVIEVRELPTVMSVNGPVVEGIQVALPIRVYADLLAAGGRWAEAAQHLREDLGDRTQA
ncbi:MAG: hypothetical protein HKL80_02110 [Acidimicrobiales bacterium]|nr:hypothetical protein [Acidimicrobiales bacterium]